MDKVVFRDMLQKTGHCNRITTRKSSSGRDKYTKNVLDDELKRFLNLDTKREGKGIETFILPFYIIDIYTRFEVLIGTKLSGHS